MQNREKSSARRFDTPQRCHAVTEIVYSGYSDRKRELIGKIREAEEKFKPSPSEYRAFFGELHGHCGLSDGIGTPDSYFTSIRDRAGLDFAALTDHDHNLIFLISTLRFY